MNVIIKNRIIFIHIFCALVFLCVNGFAQDYLDTDLPVETRVKDLVDRFTLAEKIQQMGNSAPAITRLGIPGYDYWSEALHGVARQGLATVFPQAIGLGSTWDPELMEQITTVVSIEARAKANAGTRKYLTFWSPTINLLRDPRWGREEEAYSEDPYLMGVMGTAFVKGMQGNDPTYVRTVSTIKHFVANNSEFNRHWGSSNMDQRDLREYYFPPFKACVTEGKVQSLMGAYNALNGIPCCANDWLMTEVLRNEWGFDGFTVSDCGAINDIQTGHNYTNSAANAAALGVKAGTDINCGNYYQNNLQSAINQGLVAETDLDRALYRAFKARFLLGEFDPDDMVPYKSIPGSMNDSPEHKDLALKAAQKCIVLLKNDGILPLNLDNLDSIAVIGPNANQAIFGGYSGTPSFSVTPLMGIQERIGGVIDPYTTIEAENFNTQDGIQVESCNEGGRNVGYINPGDWIGFSNVDFSTGCKSLAIRVASNTNGGGIEVYTGSLNGTMIGSCSVTGTGGWQSWTTVNCTVNEVTGITDLFMKFTGPGSDYLFNINWLEFEPMDPDYPRAENDVTVYYEKGCDISGTDKSGFAGAVEAAGKSDVAIVFAGMDLSISDEGRDRNDIILTGVQHDLIKEVYGANPRTIVVLVTGARLAMTWEDANVPGMICAWYAGQSQGTAIADVLFGDVNPGAKLTTTWYTSLNGIPDIADYSIWSNNRTYWYFTGDVLYPFGHGLSYTTFEYGNLTISDYTATIGDEITVSVDINNTGNIPGDEVVQLYIHNNDNTVKLPNKKLAGFKRITLGPGESQRVTMNLPVTGERMGYWDETHNQFRLNPGYIDIMVGSSSADIRLSEVINVGGAEPTSVPTPAPTPALECGDVNDDGDVDIVDALLIAQCYVGLVSCADTNVSDVNNDDEVDIIDALLVAQYYVDLISALNCE